MDKSKEEKIEENKKVAWYETGVGGVFIGMCMALVIIFMMATISQWAKKMDETNWDHKIRTLLQEDVTIVVNKKLEDGKSSDSFTCEQLKHYFDNRAIYARIEKKIADKKINKMLNNAPSY